jgi:phage shock protein A
MFGKLREFASNIFSEEEKELTPVEKLDLAYERLLEMRLKVLESLDGFTESKVNLESTKSSLKGKILQLEGKAKIAVDTGKDDVAKAYIADKLVLQSQVNSIDESLKEIGKCEDRFLINDSKIQTKIEVLKAKKSVLSVKYDMSKASVGINESVTGISDGPDINNAIRDIEAEIEELDLKSKAIQELVQKGVLDNVLGDVYAAETAQVTKEFNELKSKVGAE